MRVAVKFVFVVASALAINGFVLAAGASSVGLLPTEKLGDELVPDERNPFTREKVDAPVEVITEEDDTASEEGRIRKAIEALSVVGRVEGPWGNKVLLGDLILEADRELPPVISGQTQILRVRSVNANTAEIVWDEDVGREQGRTIYIAFDLAPQVGSALAGGEKVKSGQPILVPPIRSTNAAAATKPQPEGQP